MTPNSLTAEQRQLWVDALRSGEYKQGHGLLYNEKAASASALALCSAYQTANCVLERRTYIRRKHSSFQHA